MTYSKVIRDNKSHIFGLAGSNPNLPKWEIVKQPFNSNELVNELEKFPPEWVLTPLREKRPYRENWQNEKPMSRESIKDAIANGEKKTSKKGKKYTAYTSGIGLRTGDISDGLIAIDFDGLSSHELLKKIPNYSELPKTVSWTSGKAGREQRLFRVPEQYREQLKDIHFNRLAINQHEEFKCPKGEQLEFRYNSCQSVLPPSYHPDTKGFYQWIDSPQDTLITELPQFLIDFIIESQPDSIIHTEPQKEPVKQDKQPSDNKNSHYEKKKGVRYDYERYQKEIQLPVNAKIPLEVCLCKQSREYLNSGTRKGIRNDSGAALARDLIGTSNYLTSIGQDYDGEPLVLFNQYCVRCSPLINQREGTSIWKSAIKDNPTPSMTEEYLNNCIIAWYWNNSDVKKLYEVEFTEQPPKSSNKIEELPWLEQARQELFKGHWISVNSVLHEYNGQFYEEQEIGLIKRKINQWCCNYIDNKGKKSKATPESVDKVFKWVTQQRWVSPTQVNTEGLPLANGILKVSIDENDKVQIQLDNYSPDKYFTYQSDVEYNPQADKNPALKLLECLDEPYKRLFIQSLATILNPQAIKRKWDRIKALMLIGEGSNGKDTLREVISLILGKKGITGCSLNDFRQADTGRGFNLVRLASNPRINWSSENRKINIDSIQSLKQAITGDPLFVEGKGKDGIEIELNTLFIFNGNDDPQLKANQKAIQSRLALIPFDKVYSTNPIKGELQANPRYKHDKQFLINDVCPAMLNLLITAFESVYQYGIDYESSNNYFEQLALENNHLKQFSKDIGLTFTGEQNDVIYCGEIYSKLTEWYHENGFLEFETQGSKVKNIWLDDHNKNDPLVKRSNQIKSRLLEIFPKAKEIRKDNKRGIWGVRLLSQSEQDFQVTPLVTSRLSLGYFYAGNNDIYAGNHIENSQNSQNQSNLSSNQPSNQKVTKTESKSNQKVTNQVTKIESLKPISNNTCNEKSNQPSNQHNQKTASPKNESNSVDHKITKIASQIGYSDSELNSMSYDFFTINDWMNCNDIQKKQLLNELKFKLKFKMNRTI